MGRKLTAEEAADLGLEAPPVSPGRRLTAAEASDLGLDAGPVAPSGPKVSLPQALLKGVQQGGTFDWGDELGALEQAALMKATGRGDFSETYRQALGENRAESRAAAEQQPVAYYGANVLSSIPTSVAASALLPAIKVGKGANLLKKALASGAGGLMQGAIMGAGASEAENASGVLADAAKGAGLAGALGAGIPIVGAAGSRVLRGIVRPGAGAQRLADLGVDTSQFTLGQLNPGGKVAELEELASVGSTVRRQREAGAKAYEAGVMRHGMAPYAPLQGADRAEMLAAAERSFEPAYDAARVPIATAGAGEQSLADQLRKGFAAVAGDKNIGADRAARETVGDFLENQATKLQYEPGQPASTDSLLDIRSAIRKEVRRLTKNPNADDAKLALYGNAEDEVTRHIEANLSPSELQGVRDADAAYRRFSTLIKAGAAAGDQEVMRPQQLSAAIKALTPEREYAMGGGGVLREMARLGKQALEEKTPPTGVRALIPLVPYGEKLTSPLMGLANTGPVKRALLGQTGAQQRVMALIEALRSATPEAAQQFAGNLERRLLYTPASEATAQ